MLLDIENTLDDKYALHSIISKCKYGQELETQLPSPNRKSIQKNNFDHYADDP